MAIALLSSASAHAQTFDFETSTGASVPFSITEGGVTASFTSPSSGFEVLSFGPGFFALLNGNVLGDVDADLGIAPLTVTFDRLLSGITLDFAIQNSQGGTGLTLQAFLGATAVGNVFAPAAMPPGLLIPEGTITFDAGVFDRVVLSSDAVDFFVDDIAVSPAVVPEPATLGLLGAGLSLLAGGAAARRRRTSTVFGL